ncbi:unnamed protein product [Cunninghamella blakesleeana]
MSIEPFEIPSFTTEQLSDLHTRIDKTIFPQELTLSEEKVGWKYGTPTSALKPLLEKWKNEYDWEKTRTYISQWHHFRIALDKYHSLKLHFIHEPSKDPNAIPLLLLHGWPSTFYEFHKIINPLRDGANGQAYHVVVPSLPGYGFSDPTTEDATTFSKMADMINTLMVELGYAKYSCFGTDWGSQLASILAVEHHTSCIGMHVTMFFGLPPLPTFHNITSHPLKVAKFLLGAINLVHFDTIYGKGKFKVKGTNPVDTFNDDDAAYRAIQGTRPYSIAYGLTDSPAGLLGWLLEKYHFWTDHNSTTATAYDASSSPLPPTISSDEFLTQVSIYWLTNSISSSIRFYSEFLNEVKDKENPSAPHLYSIPVAISNFKYEIYRVPKEWVEVNASDLRLYTEHPTGGHFAALEVPELLIQDISTFGKKIANTF